MPITVIPPVQFGDTDARLKTNKSFTDLMVLDAAITAEANARQAGDVTEAGARQAADNAEVAARIAADNAEAAARQAGDVAEAAARQAADAAEANARQSGDAAEAAARIADDRALPLPPPLAHRPGDAAINFAGVIETSAERMLVPLTESQIVDSAGGRAARIAGAGVVASRWLFAIEPGRTYALYCVVRRIANTSDPSNDTVRVGIDWHGPEKEFMSSQAVHDYNDLLVSSGRTITRITVARAAATGVDVVTPVNAGYVRPFVRCYGGNGATNVEIIDWRDITDAGAAPDLSAMGDRVSALEGYSISSRLLALEAVSTSPKRWTVETVGGFGSETIPASVDVVEAFGRDLTGDGGGGLYVRDADGVQTSAGGAKWIEVPRVDEKQVSFWGVTDAEDAVIRRDVRAIKILSMDGTTVLGAHTRRRVNAEPAVPTLAKHRSGDRWKADGAPSVADGGWWVLDEARPNVHMFGALDDFSEVSGTGTDATAALTAAASFCASRGVTLDVPRPVYAVGPVAGLDDIHISGAGRIIVASKRVRRPPSFISQRRASYWGLDGSLPSAENTAIIRKMVSLNVPLEFDVPGTVQINEAVDLSDFAGGQIDFLPTAVIRQTGDNADANIFTGTEITGLRINGGRFRPGTVTNSLSWGNAFFFQDCTDVIVCEVLGEEHRRGVIMFVGTAGKGTYNCGWRNPKARHSVVTSAEAHDQHGVDFFVVGDTYDFAGVGGHSDGGAGVGFGAQTYTHAATIMRNVSITGYTVHDAPQYGSMFYRRYADDDLSGIVFEADVIDRVYGNVEIAGGVAGRYMYGAGHYAQGDNSHVFRAKRIANTNLNTNFESLGYGAVTIINADFATVEVDLIENPNWYGLVVADPSGAANPGKTGGNNDGLTDPAKSIEAARGLGVMADIKVIANPQKAALYKKDMGILHVRGTHIINPAAQAVYTRQTSSVHGRSLNERTILDGVHIRGGGGANNVVDIGGNDIFEWRSGSIRDVASGASIIALGADAGGIHLGVVEIDATIITSAYALYFAPATDEGYQRRADVTGAIDGTTLTVTDVEAGYLRPGDIITGSGIAANTVITAVGTGIGGVGTYTVSVSQTVASTAIIAKKQFISRIDSNASIAAKLTSGGTAGMIGNINRRVRGIEHILTYNQLSSASAYVGTTKMFSVMADTAVPNVANHEYWTTGGTTTITGLAGMRNGEERTIVCAHSVTFQHGSSFVMRSGANVAATSGMVLIFQMQNNVIRQIN